MDNVSGGPNTRPPSPSHEVNTAEHNRTSASRTMDTPKVSSSVVSDSAVHQQPHNNTQGNTKSRLPISAGPAFLRCLHSLVNPSHLNDNRFLETCERDGAGATNASSLTPEKKGARAQDLAGNLRRASIPSVNSRSVLDWFASPDDVRDLIEELNFGLGFSESGALEELSVDALQGCSPETVGLTGDSERIRDILDWQKLQKHLASQGRQVTGEAGNGSSPGGARGTRASGKNGSLDGVANQAANFGIDCNSLLCYAADGMLPGDASFYVDACVLPVPKNDKRQNSEKLSSSSLEDINQELREQMEEASSSGTSGILGQTKNNSVDKPGSTLPMCGGFLLMHRMQETLEIVGAQLLNYEERKRSQGNELSKNSSFLDRTENLLERLHQMSSDRLERLSRHLGISTHTADDINKAVNRVASLLLFNTLSLSSLRKCCKELGINTSEDPFTDVHLLPESLAEKISCRLCPFPYSQDRFSLSNLHFLPHLQVHENSSGSLQGGSPEGGSVSHSTFACSLDNAQFIGQLPLERYISNRFSCQKVKWRCMVVAKRGFLHVHLWHRSSSPLFARISIHPGEERKKKKSRGSGGNEKETGKQISENSLACNDATKNSANLELLRLKKSAVAEPNELVQLSYFLSIDQIRRGASSDAGSPFYHPNEDRIVFQLALQTSDCSSTEKSMSACGENLANTGKALMGNTDIDPVPTTGKATAESNGKDANNADDDRQQKVLQLAVSSLADEEDKGREVVHRGWDTGYRQLQYAEYREAIQARLTTKDREHKQRLAKAGPSSELQRDVEKYRLLVQTSQQQVLKLTKEKMAEEKEWKRLREKADEGKIELERLRALHDSKAEELVQLEEETRIVQQRIEEKRRKAELRRQRREQLLWQDQVKSEEPLPAPAITNGNDALSINDFGLFLANSAGGGGCSSGSSSDPIFHTSHHPLLSLQDESFGFTTSGNVGSSLDLMGGGGTNAGGGVMPSTPSPNQSAPPPVFSTQPHLRAFVGGDDLGGQVECGSSLRISPSSHQLGGMQAPPPLSTSPMVFNVGGGQGSNSMGASPHHGDPNGSNLPSIGAFGAIGGPSPFSTNPAPHHSSMYAHLDTSPPAFHTTVDVLGDRALGASLGVVHLGSGSTTQRAGISQPAELNPFTVTAGGASTSIGIPFAAFTPDPNSVLFGPPSEHCTPPVGGSSHLFYKPDLPNVESFSTPTW